MYFVTFGTMQILCQHNKLCYILYVTYNYVDIYITYLLSATLAYLSHICFIIYVHICIFGTFGTMYILCHICNIYGTSVLRDSANKCYKTRVKTLLISSYINNTEV